MVRLSLLELFGPTNNSVEQLEEPVLLIDQ